MNIVYQTIDTSVPSIKDGATAFAENTARKHFSIQNLGTNPLFVRFGSGASTSLFHIVLKGGTAQDDGEGGFYSSNGVCYTGIITIAGTSPRYTTWEIAP